MKKTITLLFLLCFLGIANVNSQNLDRIALSSGGISSDTLNATIGEIFVFSINANGVSLDAGMQSDNGNTGCITTSANQTQMTTEKPEVLVYPNPVEDFLNLRINGIGSETISFQIYDADGKLVVQQNTAGTSNLYQLQVSQLSQGNYFIQGYSAKGETIGKIKFIKL